MKIYHYKIQLGFLILLSLLELVGVFGLAFWREGFWNAIENHQLKIFIYYIIYFTVIALGLCLISGISSYIQNRIALHWRKQLTRVSIKQSRINHIEGFEQRIQEDCRDYPQLVITLLRGFMLSSLYVIGYSILIICKIGIIYLIVPLLYTVIGTYISFKIAKPLISMNYIVQVKEAFLRKFPTLINYAITHRVNYNMFRKLKHLNYFQSFYDQLGIIFPYLLLAPLYFSLKLTFGALMQLASALTHLIDSLGFIINSFSEINNLLACRKRLKEYNVI